jgi:hypothetical protein
MAAGAKRIIFIGSAYDTTYTQAQHIFISVDADGIVIVNRTNV